MVLPEKREWISFEDPEEYRTWLFDVTFLTSRWTCTFGGGCPGILGGDDGPALGCCVDGAALEGQEEAERIQEVADALTPDLWQFHGQGGPVYQDEFGDWRTRVVEGGCVFANRAGFPGGVGCALHLAAVARGEDPMSYKPEVCSMVPLRREDMTDTSGHVTSMIREWRLRDWGELRESMSWWCIDSQEAYCGRVPVYKAMERELRALCGDVIYDKLAAHLAGRGASAGGRRRSPTGGRRRRGPGGR